MLKGLIGKKLGMTRLFMEGGKQVPVTMLEVGPCTVTQVKTMAKEKYNAVQLGFAEALVKSTNKPAAGHLKKSGKEALRFLKEFRVDESDSFELGQSINAELFTVGEKVHVTGRTKGRGFSGVVKRHGFGGGRKTHGSTTHDAPGSIGNSADPSRVMKGRKLPGRYGDERRQVRNLKIVDIRPEFNLVLVQGAVPGANGSIIVLEKAAASGN